MPKKRVRATLRCLQRDLGVALDQLHNEADLDVFTVPMLATARAEVNSGKTLETVNTHPEGVTWLEIEQGEPCWRGVVWQDPNDSDLYWLVAAGKHQEDSGNDFWKRLERVADLFTRQPTDDDFKRLRLEGPAREAASCRRDAQEVRLAAASRLGQKHAKTLFGARVELVIDDLGGNAGQVRVGITVRGPAHEDVPVIVLRALCPFIPDEEWWVPRPDDAVAGDMHYETLWELSALAS